MAGAAKSRKGGLNQCNFILRKQRAGGQWDWMRAREQSEPKGMENSIFDSQKNYSKVQTLLLRVRLPSLDLTRLFLSTEQCFSTRWAEAAMHVQTNCCPNHSFCRSGWCWAPANIDDKIKWQTESNTWNTVTHILGEINAGKSSRWYSSWVYLIF